MIKDIKNNKKILLLIVVLLIFTIGVTLAYFQAQIGAGATANVTVTTKTTDVLTFNKGSDISITATQANFGSGAGNRTGSTTATATLLANNDTNSATNTYNVYLFIQSNSFTYTTSPTNTPELMLTITNPNNQAVTSLTGLTYTTSGGVSGFDITTKKGLIQIASNYTITSTGTKTDTWNITITFVNLNSDQQYNTGKTFTGQIIIQKEEISSYYWNDNFGNHRFAYPSTPTTTYPTLAQLQSNYANFSTNPVYIKTQAEHEACLYYNNHEFCFGANYWEGTIGVYDSAAGLATKTKLQTSMEAALQTSANQDGCDSDYFYAGCSFGDFSCYAYSSGDVDCGSYVTHAACEVYSDGAAGCWLEGGTM